MDEIGKNYFTPAEIAQMTEAVAIKKIDAPTRRISGLAYLGGLFIALGGVFSIVATAGTIGILPWGIIRLLMGLAFSLGLILVIIAGGQLFTSDVLMVMAWASGRLRLKAMLSSWSLVWLGNLTGAFSIAVLLTLTDHYNFGHGEFGKTAIYIANTKIHTPLKQAFFLGILCNLLVCLATWIAMAAKDVTGKIVAVIFPITCFVAAGFDHCVANMFFISYGILTAEWAPTSYWIAIGIERPYFSFTEIIENLLVVSIGNWVGGALLVGGIYWWVFRSQKVTTNTN